jgi:predicted CopG family antitoxin
MNRTYNVRVKYNVYKRLVRRGMFGDSFSDIIRRLLDENEGLVEQLNTHAVNPSVQWDDPNYYATERAN